MYIQKLTLACTQYAIVRFRSVLCVLYVKHMCMVCTPKSVSYTYFVYKKCSTDMHFQVLQNLSLQTPDIASVVIAGTY